MSTLEVRDDSLYKFANAYFDELQNQYVWGIADLPSTARREDDQFYTLREDDRLDLISYRLLGSPQWFWVIMHYNDIPNALDLAKYVGKEIRLPSKATIERLYQGGAKRSDNNTNPSG